MRSLHAMLGIVEARCPHSQFPSNSTSGTHCCLICHCVQILTNHSVIVTTVEPPGALTCPSVCTSCYESTGSAAVVCCWSERVARAEAAHVRANSLGVM